MKERLTVVKIGGALLEDDALLDEISRAFASMQGMRILVHGGGKRASEVSRALGIEPNLKSGRRITDAKTLEVVTMVYGGWANKTLVARLQSLGCNAIGLSGADADLIRAVKRPVRDIDYGFVGDVERVAVKTLVPLLQAGL
ncbi:MAG: acetylglutamate kinase, partial [Robiginitalea sp.]|nr:acetylglutamate kinase [Robiginitalea sp.]